MALDGATLWWVAAGVLVAVELATGTFYLLMVALGAAAAALAAHAGVSLSMQLVLAAVIGGGATAAWHLKRSREPKAETAERNPDVVLDIGQRVRVDAWASDGSARIQYRGAGWSARFAGPGTPQPGEYVIVSVQGSQLLLAPQA
jgi:membrane protein implicated in regulation of membrane protease activity